MSGYCEVAVEFCVKGISGITEWVLEIQWHFGQLIKEYICQMI